MATPSTDAYTPQGPKPVFIQGRDVPRQNNNLTGGEVYIALTRLIDHHIVTGVQRIGSLWRIYVNCHDARVRLITTGIVIRNTSIPVYDTNPHTKTKNEHLTRVLIKDVPLSVGDELIKSTLEKMKCQVRGEIIRQKLRVHDELIDCFNGDRVCFIDPPSQPLPRFAVVGNIFRARLFHVGQPERTTTCSRCLEAGHHSSQCKNSVKCKACHKTGHISNDCPDSVNTAASGELRNTPADRGACDRAGNPGQKPRDQAAANSGASRSPQQESDYVTSSSNAARNSTMQQPDKHEPGNNGQSARLDTTSHASANVDGQRSDDPGGCTRTPQQKDISYFLRPKHSTSSPNKHENQRSTPEQTEHGSDNTNTSSSDDSYTDEEQSRQTLKPPTPKKTRKRKSERKRGNQRK